MSKGAGLPQLARAGRRVSQPAVGAPVSVLRRAQNDLRALWGHLGIKVGLAVPAAGGLDWELLVLDCGKVSVLSAARLRRGDRIVRVQEETELRAMIARLALLDSCGENEPQVVELEVEFRTLAEAASVAETAMPLKCQGLDLSDWEDDDLPSLPSYSENSRSLDILAGAGESRERTMMIRLRRVIRGLREAEIQVILDKMILQGEPLVSASSPGDSDAIAVEAERLSQTLLRVAGFQEDDDDKKDVGGKRLWRALVDGRQGAGRTGAAVDQDLPVPLSSLWSEALLRISAESLELRREELMAYAEMWSTRLIEAEHYNQLDEIDDVSERALSNLVKNNSGLRKLYAYSIAVTENTIKVISSGCPELEKMIVYEASLEDDQKSYADVLTDQMMRLLANGCRKLRKLTLRYNQVLVSDRSLAALAKKCRKLESFVIDYCDKDGGITDFGVCTIAHLCRNLKCLNISNGVITDVSLIVIADQLPFLEDLSLEFSEITDVGVYALMNRCEKLARLIVHNSDSIETGITDNTACVIANYASDEFRSLGLGFADITDEGLKTICFNVELSFLSINGCSKLTYEGLKSCFCYLDCLWNLDISFTDIVGKDEQLLEIGNSLPCLETLDITDCFSVSQESVKAFKEKFPHCKVNM